MRALLLTALASVIAASAYGDAEIDAFLAEFVVGHYLLIGQRPDTGSTHHGRMEIYRDRTGLRIKRSIGEETVMGAAAVESALRGDARVLRLRFTENQTAYESTCLVQGDLDNHARLSCHLYRRDGKTRRPGLEALFIDPDQR